MAQKKVLADQLDTGIGANKVLQLDNNSTLQLGNGSASAPTYTFSSDTDVGMYRSSTNELSLSAGNTQNLSISSTEVTVYEANLIVKGDVSSQNIHLWFRQDDDTNRGIVYFDRTAEAVIAQVYDSSGVAQNNFQVREDYCLTNNPVRSAGGSATVPSFSFSTDTNTGLYRSGADEISLSTGGTLRLTLSTDALTTTEPVRVPDGSISAPAFSFSTATNLGIYNGGTSTNIRIAAGGGNPFRFIRNTSTHTRFSMTDSNSVQIVAGTGDPNGTFSAGVGSLFLRSNGGAGTTLYVKESGSGTTGWVAK